MKCIRYAIFPTMCVRLDIEITLSSYKIAVGSGMQ